MNRTLKSLLIVLALAFGMSATGTSYAGETGKNASASARKYKVVKAKAKAKRVAYQKQARKRAAIQYADGRLAVASASVLVQDQTTGSVLYEKNGNVVVPIASITKLMTAMVVLDAQPALGEIVTISYDDVDTLKGTHSRLLVGTRLTREEMLRLALMSSENRAASALSRYYPGGRPAFVEAMNRKARSLGLVDTHFEDSTGLTPANVSTARELARMVEAAHQYPLIRSFSTDVQYDVLVKGRRQIFRNTNALVRNSDWDIGLSKTGYISEAGKCLVMQAWLNNKPVVIVLLDAAGKLTRIGDANRIRRWIESASLPKRQSTG